MLDTNPDLRQLVATWARVPKSTFNTKLECKVPETMWVKWLWAILEPDPISEWIRLSGLPDAEHIRRACYQAIETLLVLPDGSLAECVRNYLQPRKAEKATG